MSRSSDRRASRRFPRRRGMTSVCRQNGERVISRPGSAARSMRTIASSSAGYPKAARNTQVWYLRVSISKQGARQRGASPRSHRPCRVRAYGLLCALRRIGLLHTLYAKNDLWHDPPKFLEIRAPAHQCAAHQDRHGRESPHSTNFDLAHTGPTLAER
jgi:hypothetical protein